MSTISVADGDNTYSLGSESTQSFVCVCVCV